MSRIAGLNRSILSLTSELRLRLRNRFSRQLVTSPEAPVVSLTSYGKRLERVYLTIESIGAGSRKPSRLLLWIDDAEVAHNPPVELQRLVRRGLEILPTIDLGPHKKYYPFVSSTNDFSTSLVTADDDVYYPHRWLETLETNHRANPHDVIALRARWIGVEDGKLAPYASWQKARIGSAAPRVFPTGVGGVLYPVAILRALRQAGDGFRLCAPRADDVWLHANTIRSGHIARHVASPARVALVPVRKAGVGGLWESNVANHGNDVQIAQTYTDAEIYMLNSSHPDAATRPRL